MTDVYTEHEHLASAAEKLWMTERQRQSAKHYVRRVQRLGSLSLLPAMLIVLAYSILLSLGVAVASNLELGLVVGLMLASIVLVHLYRKRCYDQHTLLVEDSLDSQLGAQAKLASWLDSIGYKIEFQGIEFQAEGGRFTIRAALHRDDRWVVVWFLAPRAAKDPLTMQMHNREHNAREHVDSVEKKFARLSQPAR